jgi:hypothetical protein
MSMPIFNVKYLVLWPQQKMKNWKKIRTCSKSGYLFTDLEIFYFCQGQNTKVFRNRNLHTGRINHILHTGIFVEFFRSLKERALVSSSSKSKLSAFIVVSTYDRMCLSELVKLPCASLGQLVRQL